MRTTRLTFAERCAAARLALLLPSLAIATTGCGASQQPTPATAAAAGEQTKVVYWVAREVFPNDTALPRTDSLAYKEELAFADALEAKLSSLNYQVSKYALSGGDVEVTLEVARQQDTAKQLAIDDSDAAILVGAWVAGRCISSAWIVFDPEDPVPEGDLERIFGMLTAQRVLSPAQRVALDREAAMRNVYIELRDQSAWDSAGSASCRHPTALDACDGVHRYLVDYPNGKHLQEARLVIEQGRPLRDELAKEDRYWQAAEPNTCGAQGGRACDMVQTYLLVFHSGRYEAQARELLASHGIEAAR